MKTQLFTEIWKDIPGYIGLYQASTFGRIRNKKRNKIVLSKINKSGYLQIKLHKENIRKFYMVHRLVYETFVGIIPDGMQVNHINEIKTDNSVWNLNLMTPKENNNYGKRNEKISNKLRNNHRSKKIRQCDLNTGELIKIYPSLHEMARITGFNRGHIIECINGKTKSSYGFKWELL